MPIAVTATAALFVLSLCVLLAPDVARAAPFSPLWKRDEGTHVTRSIDSEGRIDMEYLRAKDLLGALGRHKRRHPTDRHEVHDPRWRFGRWGAYGGRMDGSEFQWAHRPMRDIASERAADSDDWDIEMAASDPWRAEETEVHHWAIPSPLTPSGIPPIVAHIPMTPEEERAYERGLEEQASQRMRTVHRPPRLEVVSEADEADEADASEEEHRLPPAEHPLPAPYKARVREVAAAAGFEWVGLAVPSVVPDEHLFRAQPRLVRELLLEAESEVRADVAERESREERHHHGHGHKKDKKRGERSDDEEGEAAKRVPDPQDALPPLDPAFSETESLKDSFTGAGEDDEDDRSYADEVLREDPTTRRRDPRGRLDPTEVEWRRIERRRDRDLLYHENLDHYYHPRSRDADADADADAAPEEGEETAEEARRWKEVESEMRREGGVEEAQRRMERFARLMRRRNERRRARRDWQRKWEHWEQRAVKRANITARDARGGDVRGGGVRGGGDAEDHTTRDADGRGWEARLAMARRLRERLVVGQAAHVRAAAPQHPEARETRGPTRVGRQPTFWTSYRERWDAPVEDERPARWIQHGRRFTVGDPMLTEQWSVYDAAARGDLPPGVYPTRPSISGGPAIWDDLELDGSDVGIGVVDSGIELAHPELVHRYTRATSYDALNPSRNRPPTPVDPWIETHGTQAAGVAVAERDNGHCGVGLAPGARLGAIRLLGLRSPTDAEEAAAISHACRPHGFHPSHQTLINAVFSCSWGPVDNGGDLRGPGRLAAAAMDRCVHQVGRNGRGSVYVWAGGNGRANGDNVNFDGYANRPETIAVGALDDQGRQAWYSEPGAALLLMAPSSGGSSGVVSADPSGPAGLSTGRCTRLFGGTSAAAPAVAGVVAQVLQADPGLGWRDVQHIFVRASERVAANDRREPWALNRAGLWHSHGYGFGLLNATKAVLLATGWSPLDPANPLVRRSPRLSADDTWVEMHSGEDVGSGDWRGGKRGARSSPSIIDTASYDPETGHHLHRVLAKRDAGGAPHKTDGEGIHDSEALAEEPLEGDKGDKGAGPEKPAADENLALSALLFAPRFMAYKARQVRDAVLEVAARERRKLEDARREVAPYAVRRLRERAGIAIPPGHSAYFNWDYAEGGAEDETLGALEHVGLSVHVETPGGRGLLRIWLCAPSGTCSLMAPAPRGNDRHRGISGAGWTFWSVRHWGEQPRYDEDLTGHGPGTWSLRLTYVTHWDPVMAKDMHKERRRHPERTDAIVHWWALEFRGTAEAPPLL